MHSESGSPSPGHEPGKPADGKRGIWDNPKNVQILIWSFWACCAVVFALDLFFNRYATFKNGELDIEQAFGFYSIYGFVACVLLVLIAKQMRRVLMRDEDYYEDGPADPGDIDRLAEGDHGR